MAAIKELLKVADNGGISFGDYELDTKTKLADFEFEGDVYKVKTFSEITKLEKNGMLVYESVPGTAVTGLVVKEEGMQFTVSGNADAQITVELEADAQYQVAVDGVDIGCMGTNLGGKLSFSAPLEDVSEVMVNIQKA